MKHYTLRLTVYLETIDPEYGRIGKKVRSFLGNDKEELIEKYEMWVIKQGFDRNDARIHIDNVQHANNKI